MSAIKNKLTNKNGKIEFARFAFSVIVMLFHIYQSIGFKKYDYFGQLTFFKNGWFSVEFFFVVSGFLMAASAFKNQNSGNEISKETFTFMRKKILAILPYHLIVFTVSFIYLAFARRVDFYGFIKMFIEAIPNFLLIQRSGLTNRDVLGLEWYISDMLIAMFILYPFCKKYYERFSKTVAPVLSLLIAGYLIRTTGALNGTLDWSVIVSKTLLRAIAEICAGVFIFEVCRNLKTLNFSKKDKVALTILEVFAYIVVLGYIIGNFPAKYSGTVLIFVCIGVCLSFSDVTYGAKLFNNKIVYYLGSLSLPLYLCHSIVRVFGRFLFREYLDFGPAVTVFFLVSCVYAVATSYLGGKLGEKINKKIVKISHN